MRRIALWALATVTILVLLFSYHTSTSSTTVASVASARAGAAGEGTETATYAGEPVATRYGTVQVQVTVADGRVILATALQVPNRNPRDLEINNRAVPILNREVLDSQSADIDMVSGATVTSVGYIQSLQSALDQAHG